VSAEGLTSDLIEFLPFNIKSHITVKITQWIGAECSAPKLDINAPWINLIPIQPAGAVLDLRHLKRNF
jgi:hypothetical protein